MKTFLAVYTGTPSDKWAKLTEAEQKKRGDEGMKAWGVWVEKNSGAIEVMGSPLGKTKRVDASGIHDTRNELTGYTIIRAESHEDAAKKFLEHPHFSIFPGDAVEIMECLSIPGM